LDFEPPPPKQISARKRAKFPEFPRRIKTKSVGVPSARPPFGSFKILLCVSGVVLRFRSNLLYQKFVRISTSVSRALKRLCAKHRASAEAEVRENALHSATIFWGQRRRSAEMRNASEILRNAGGLGESISQNSLRVLPDFLAGFWRA